MSTRAALKSLLKTALATEKTASHEVGELLEVTGFQTFEKHARFLAAIKGLGKGLAGSASPLAAARGSATAARTGAQASMAAANTARRGITQMAPSLKGTRVIAGSPEHLALQARGATFRRPIAPTAMSPVRMPRGAAPAVQQQVAGAAQGRLGSQAQLQQFMKLHQQAQAAQRAGLTQASRLPRLQRGAEALQGAPDLAYRAGAGMRALPGAVMKPISAGLAAADAGLGRAASAGLGVAQRGAEAAGRGLRTPLGASLATGVGVGLPSAWMGAHMGQKQSADHEALKEILKTAGVAEEALEAVRGAAALGDDAVMALSAYFRKHKAPEGAKVETKIAALKLASRIINADVGLDQIIAHMKKAQAAKKTAAIEKTAAAIGRLAGAAGKALGKMGPRAAAVARGVSSSAQRAVRPLAGTTSGNFPGLPRRFDLQKLVRPGTARAPMAAPTQGGVRAQIGEALGNPNVWRAGGAGAGGLVAGAAMYPGRR